MQQVRCTALTLVAFNNVTNVPLRLSLIKPERLDPAVQQQLVEKTLRAAGKRRDDRVLLLHVILLELLEHVRARRGVVGVHDEHLVRHLEHNSAVREIAAQ